MLCFVPAARLAPAPAAVPTTALALRATAGPCCLAVATMWSVDALAVFQKSLPMAAATSGCIITAPVPIKPTPVPTAG